MNTIGANVDKTDHSINAKKYLLSIDFAQPACLLLDNRPPYHSAHIYCTSIKINEKKRDKRCLCKKIQAIHM